MTRDRRDSATVERARRGDGAAFLELADGHLERAYRIASVLVGREEADAVVEDAFAAAWEELPRLPDPAQFGAWLESILIGACIMRARQAPVAAAEWPAAAPAEGVLAHTEALDRDQALRLLDQLFDRLEPRDRAVLVLHDVAGRTLPEIARVVHEPIGSVRLRLAGCKGSLVGALEPDA